MVDSLKNTGYNKNIFCKFNNKTENIDNEQPVKSFGTLKPYDLNDPNIVTLEQKQFEDAIEQIVFGNFSNKTTDKGALPRVISQFIPVLSAYKDILDTSYDMRHIKNHKLSLAVDLIGFAPLVVLGIKSVYKIVNGCADTAKAIKNTTDPLINN